MTDAQRIGAALVLFVAGAVVATVVSVIAGALLTLAALAMLMWGRRIGDRGPR